MVVKVVHIIWISNLNNSLHNTGCKIKQFVSESLYGRNGNSALSVISVCVCVRTHACVCMHLMCFRKLEFNYCLLSDFVEENKKCSREEKMNLRQIITVMSHGKIGLLLFYDFDRLLELIKTWKFVLLLKIYLLL